MDKTLLTKTISGGVLVVAALILTLTGKVDGPTALDAIKWIGVTFLGGAAVMGTASALMGKSGSGQAPPAAKNGNGEAK